METKKIAIGCFVGGVLCTAVASMFTPMFWWLGLLAGMAGGYLGYEFREVLWAIPIAWRKSRKGISNWWLNTDKKVREWSAKPHPIVYTQIIITTVLILGIAIKISEDSFWDFRVISIILGSVFLVEMAACAFLFAALPFLGLVILLAFIGARVGEKCFWFPFIMLEDRSQESQESEVKKLEKKGYRKETLTGKNFFRWFVKGIDVVIVSTFLFLVWIMWKYLAIGIWLLLCFLRRFGWELFKLIHSKKRVLCAIDGTIGGAIAFFCFASASLTFPQQILVVFFGGLLGAVIGVLNYEIVSKWILNLVPAVNNI